MQLIITENLQPLNTHLSTLYQRLNGDLAPLMSSIGAVLENSTRARFKTKTAPDGVRWENLKPSTLKSKRKKSGKATGILFDRGDLMKSITYQSSSQSVAVGTDRLYGKYHQTGTKKMAARPFLGISNQDRITINELIGDFING